MAIGQATAGETLAEGATIGGRYRVQGLLGRGAAGAVYRVRDERTGQGLALKRLHAPAGQQALFAAQFEREYHTLAQLEHPSIIEVYDFGIDGGAFYTMELLEGPELRTLCPLSWRSACELLRDVASSLAVLHSRRLLHRDISVRNVRLTAGGRAKLLDFGAMMPMGPIKHMVGTPPFAAPEALQLQAIDARADLYSLGALAYYALSGRYAYAARTFRELQAAFAQPPQPLHELVPDVPEALERLIAQLLQLDRDARPATAAEVMERLSGIAGLPLHEHAQVTRAYLATPALVGRDPALHHANAFLRATEEHGGCLLIEGESGVGRSRVLDAAVLRAKLLGITVVRGDAGDGERPYGVMQALCAQLFDLLPEPALRQATLQRSVLSHVIDVPGTGPRSEPTPEPRHLHAALVDFVRALARAHPIAIAVDDVELVDEPSAALIAALCHGAAKRKLALLLTTCSSAPPVPALGLIREVAETIALAPLSATESEALLRSVFGDNEHLPGLAHRAHQLSGGNPRWLMTLAEHMVDREVARYEAGSWTLPSAVTAETLPESLTAALALRAGEIPEPARELAQTLALTDVAALAPHNLAALLAQGDLRRGYAALDALLASGVLVSVGDCVRFSQPELGELLRTGIEPAREREMHRRIAAALAQSDDLVRIADHLLRAGQTREAADCLLPMTTSSEITFSSLALSVFERVYQQSAGLTLPAHARQALRTGIVAAAALHGDRERFELHAGPFLAELIRDSGLADYAALDELPAEQRLSEALTRLQQRYDATPERARGLAPVEAITALARLCSTYVGLASIVQDPSLLAPLPDLTPLFPLSPALVFVQRLVDGMNGLLMGCHNRSWEVFRSLLASLEQPDHAGLDPALHSTARLSMLYLQGIYAAGAGQPDAARWVIELVNRPGHRVNAWRVRMTAALMLGDVETAANCHRQAELLGLQDGGRVPFPGSWERMAVVAYVNFDDVVGVKRAIERLERTAASYPGRQPTLAWARGHYLRLMGDPRAGLAVILPVIGALQVTQHPDWPYLAALHVQLLVELGRHGEAAQIGSAYRAACIAHEVEPGHRYVGLQLIPALIELGRASEALPISEQSLREVEALGSQGCELGMHCEARARVALALGDAAGFSDYAERCEREYRRGRNRALRARYERLLERGRARGLGRPGAAQDAWSAPPRPIDSSLPITRTGGVVTTASSSTLLLQSVSERLAACEGAGERARELAKLVLEATRAEGCLLFAVMGGGLRFIAAHPAQRASAALIASLERHLHAQLQSDDTLTAVVEPERLLGVGGRPDEALEPLLLQTRRHDQRQVVGLAALRYGAARYELPDRGLLAAVAEALLDDDQADCVTRVD
jgi:hypothetical protein